MRRDKQRLFTPCLFASFRFRFIWLRTAIVYLFFLPEDRTIPKWNRVKRAQICSHFVKALRKVDGRETKGRADVIMNFGTWSVHNFPLLWWNSFQTSRDHKTTLLFNCIVLFQKGTIIRVHFLFTFVWKIGSKGGELMQFGAMGDSSRISFDLTLTKDGLSFFFNSLSAIFSFIVLKVNKRYCGTNFLFRLDSHPFLYAPLLFYLFLFT